MLEFWMHEVALMLFVWVIAHHYQYWSVISFLKKTPPQLQPPSPQVGKKPEQAKKEFQGLTVKPVKRRKSR
jgi:hypothetical protein